jgi:hypothetical protein
MTDQPSSSGTRTETIATAICFALPLVLYALTAARTVQGGDSGELGLIGLLGGVAHPPGYPLYSVLARLGAHLFFGPPFYRVALVSSCLGAAAVAVLQRVAWRISGDLFASTAAALLFAVAPIPWRLAGIPEVFALHALATATLLLLSLRLAEAGDDTVRREAFLLGLAGGLGLSNHLSIIWCAPVVVWALIRAFQPGRRGAILLRVACGGLVGLLPYAALPIFARSAPPGAVVWGDVRTWHGFVDHVLRQQYGTLQLSGRGGAFFHLDPVLDLMRSIGAQYAYVFALVAAVGVVVLFRRGAPFAVALITAFLLAGPLFASRFNFPPPRILALELEQRFHLMPALLMVPFIAAGLASVAKVLRPALQVTVLVGILGLQILGNYGQANWKRDTFIQRYVTEAVSHVDPDSVLVGSTDTIGPAVRWVTQVERVRPDVHYMDINLVRLPWYQSLISREIQGLPSLPADWPRWRLAFTMATRHPTYVFIWDDIDRNLLSVAGRGLVDRIVRPGAAWEPLKSEEAHLLDATSHLGDLSERPIDAQSGVLRHVLALRWVNLGQRFGTAGDDEGARRCVERGRAIEPAE